MIREDTEYLSFGDGRGGGLATAAGGAFPSSSTAGGDIGAAAAAPGDETGPLPMYEDTQFLTGPLPGSIAGGNGQQPAGSDSAAATASGGGGGFGGSGFGFGGDDTGLLVREDTCFLPDAPVAGESA